MTISKVLHLLAVRLAQAAQLTSAVVLPLLAALMSASAQAADVAAHAVARLAGQWQAQPGEGRPPEEQPWSMFLYRDFTLAIVGRFCFMLGSSMQTVAIGWLVYALTSSTFALGYLGLAGFMPALVLMLASGWVADRFPRRLVMATSALVMGVSSLVLLVNVWNGAPDIWLIYLTVIVFASARAFYQPAATALIPALVTPRHLSNAISTGSAAQQIAVISGPALGGLLYALDARLPFFGAALTFAVCAGSLTLIRHATTVAQREPTTWTSLVAGLRFTFANRHVLGPISLDMFAVLLGGAVALMPVFARDILDSGPLGLGLLRSAPAVGALITASTFTSRTTLRHSGYVLLVGVGTFGLATVGFGLSQNFLLSLAFLVLVGAADVVNVVIRMTIVQVETPDELRGRVAAVNNLFITTANDIGEFEAGFLAGLIGTVTAVVVGGLGAVGVAVVWSRLFPELRDRDHLVPPG